MQKYVGQTNWGGMVKDRKKVEDLGTRLAIVMQFCIGRLNLTQLSIENKMK